MAALQAEVARLEEAQTIQRAADSALDSLQDKIAVLQASKPTPRRKASEILLLSRLPGWILTGFYGAVEFLCGRNVVRPQARKGFKNCFRMHDCYLGGLS